MDDDAGAMSAWYVFGALGLYPLVPGTLGFVRAAPLVSSAWLRSDGGERVRLVPAPPGTALANTEPAK
jgi:putative alpha-1,2-mannosidase